MRCVVCVVMGALLFPACLQADELTFGWEASWQTNIQWPDYEAGIPISNLTNYSQSGDLGGLLPDIRALSEGQATASASYTATGEGYKLGLDLEVAAHGSIEVFFPGSEFYVEPLASAFAESYWHGRFTLEGDGELPFNSILTNWSLDGQFSGSVGFNGYIYGAVQFMDPFGFGNDAGFEFTKYWDTTQEDPVFISEGSPDISGLFAIEHTIGSGRDVSYSGSLTAHGQTVNGSIHISLGHTAELDSITFPDGSTPESHGFTIVMDSGLPSPNLASVPEPSSLPLLAAGGCGVLACATLRKRWRPKARIRQPLSCRSEC